MLAKFNSMSELEKLVDTLEKLRCSKIGSSILYLKSELALDKLNQINNIKIKPANAEIIKLKIEKLEVEREAIEARIEARRLKSELDIQKTLNKNLHSDLKIERNLRKRLESELEILDKLVPLPKIIRCDDFSKPPIGEPGIVYFIYSAAESNYVKIGKTKNLLKRKQQLQTGNPSNFKLLGYIIGYTEEEKLYKYYYRLFKTKEGGKEWYQGARFRFEWINEDDED